MLRIWDLRALVLAAAAYCSSVPATAGTNQFTLIGPDGGFVRQVQFHPATPSIAFALTAGGYDRSTDAGLNWQRVGTNMQFAPEDLAVAPLDPNRVIVVVPGQAPLVSTDAGATLASIGNYPIPGGARHVEFAANSTIVYAALGVRVARSTDEGRTWTEVTPVPSNPNSELQFLRVDPLNADIVYVYDLNQGGFRSTDGGASWNPLPLPPNTFDLTVTGTTLKRLWAVSPNSGVHRSEDNGATWPDVFPVAAFTIARDPQDPSVLYVGTAPDGLFRTMNDGTGWANVHGNARVGQMNTIAINRLDPTQLMIGGTAGVAVGVPDTTGGVGGVWESRNRGIRAASAGDMSLAAGSGRLYVNTFGAGVHFLADGAVETTPVGNAALLQVLPAGSVANTFGVLAQSRRPDRLFVGLFGGYRRSNDGGVTWQSGSTGDGRTVEHFADSPGNPDLILAATDDGLHRSVNGGDTWTPANAGLPAQARASTLVFSSSAPGTAYAGFASGVYKSTDSGASWEIASQGFPAIDIRALAVDPRNAQVVYAAAAANGLLKTTNGGSSWSLLLWPNTPGLTLAVAIDPDLPDIVYVGGANTFARSIDGGNTWQELRASDAHPEMQAVTMLADPRSAGTLLVSTFSHGLAEMTVAPNLVLESGGAFTDPLLVNSQQTFRYRMRNAGPFHATGARAVVTLPADATGISATTTSGSCVVQAVTVTCTAPTLLLSGTVDLVVRSTHPTAGTFQVLASVSGDQPDHEPTDNEVRYTLTVVQPPDPSSGGGGGGGGSSSVLWLLALAALSYAKPRRFRTS